VWFRGDDVASLDPLVLRRRVGMVFQRATAFAGSVRDNLRVADPDLDDDDAALALDRADLAPEFLDRPADDLSGGEAQRMCLARTLVTAPEVLLMDEPTSSLDARSRRVLEGMTQALARDGVPVVWVTHDVPQARRLADEVVVLAEGRVGYAGTPEGAQELLDEG
jgi:putative ABC transport system ATP-binding protein